MTPIEVLADGFDRVAQELPQLLDGLTQDQLGHRITPDANSLGWLVWHLLRVQDDHVASVAETEQVWTAQQYVDRFGLPFSVSATGYGQTSQEVGQTQVSADLLLEYAEAVHAATRTYLSTLTADDLDRVVDTNWNPPVTLGVRLVSVINDDTQHLGQAAFIRGMLAPT